ncbi:hypothetical protein Tco_0179280 [Tanacetum coccineum]
MSMTAYADLDHAGCQDTRRSTSGSAKFLGDKLVSWSSNKQKCTAISSIEAEYIGLSRHGLLYDHAKACDYIASQPVLPIFHRLEFGKCSMRLKTDIKPKEATFQVVMDALALTPFYHAFLITTDVPAIYIDLGHNRDITYLTYVNVDYLHQPWIAFATVINKFLSGKETRMDKIHLQFQIENKDAKKTNKMSYPRFTKIIIDYIMSKDQSISRRNKMFWHTARDDTMFTSMRCISRHEDTQVYGTIIPKELTNQAMLESNAYKTYYAFASGKKSPKPKIKSKAKVTKSDKKKQLAKKPKAKGIAVLCEVALTGAEQLKLATKRSKKDFHISYASGSCDGVDTQSKVPDEQPQKTSGTDEGTGTIPGVPDVPTYESESKKESWGDSEDEDDNDDDGDSDDHDNDSDDERTDSDRDEIPDPNLTNVDQTEHEEEDVNDKVHTPSNYEFIDDEKLDDEETMDDEEDDEVTKELYDDVNVNLGSEDTDMTIADQGASEQQNTGGPTQSSSVSSDFTSKLLNLDNPSLTDNEIASLMDTTAQQAIAIPKITSKTTTLLHALPDFASVFKFNERVFKEKDVSEIKQVDQYAQALSSIPNIVDHYMDDKLREAINKAILAHNLDCRQEAQDEKNAYIELIDTSMGALIKEEVNTQLPQILPQAVSEFELTKILIDKMEKNKSYDKADYKKKLYDALVESYNTDKDLFDSYGEVVSLKRSRDDSDKDQDPSAGSD